MQLNFILPKSKSTKTDEQKGGKFIDLHIAESVEVCIPSFE